VVSHWYNAQKRKLLVATGSAVWCHVGIAPVPIRWVLVRDPASGHEPAAFLGTDLDATRTMILRWFVARWRVERGFSRLQHMLMHRTERLVPEFCTISDVLAAPHRPDETLTRV
jgi:hypothetical protein